MSEEAQNVEDAAGAAQQKKKSKLPIFLVLVLVLGGGGFFAMKLRAGGAKPEITLSKEKPAELKEFLINLRDPGVYCRTEIALGLAAGASPTLIDDHEAAVRDAINLRITSKYLKDVNTVAGMERLKRDIAADLNKILADPKDAKAAGGADPAGSASQNGPASHAATGNDQADKSATPLHPDWDSQTGPVLKVYFSSFATQ
ncbi:MAG: flagellar basal body-associated FliL family protein [Fimbriimonadaceae bacterium]